jgi:hypothetical protein
VSHLADQVDAWVEELTATVDGLADVKEHRYAPWSVENLGAVTNERHLAVWPAGEPETTIPYLAGAPPADLATQKFIIAVWEDASAESTRRMDDDQANLDWLDLHEAIRDRLYDLDNQHLGWDQSANVRYQGVVFDVVGSLRVMVITFNTEAFLVFT